MTTDKPTPDQSQGKSKTSGYAQSASSTSQEDAVGAIKSLINEAVKQSQETRQPELGSEALAAVALYAEIKNALAAPTIDKPRTGPELWTLPK